MANYFPQKKVNDRIGLGWEGKLPGSVSTMYKKPATEGATGELAPLMGAAMLGPIAPAVAAIANPVVGSGLSGAMLTNMFNPTDSEAGLFTKLGDDMGSVMKGMFKKPGKWLMSDGKEMYEMPTSGMARGFMDGKPFNSMKDKLGKMNFTKQDIDDAYRTGRNKDGYNMDDMLGIKQAEQYVLNHNQKNVGLVPGYLTGDFTKGTSGIFKHAEPNKSYVTKYADNPSKFNTSIHEVNHGLQKDYGDVNILSHKYDDMTPYNNRSYEIESRMAGNRAAYPKELTDPNSKYGIHPEIAFNPKTQRFDLNAEHMLSTIGYGNGKAPSNRYANLIDESKRLNELYAKDMGFNTIMNRVGKYSEQDMPMGLPQRY